MERKMPYSGKTADILLRTGRVEASEVPPEEAVKYTDGSLGPVYAWVKELPAYPHEMEEVMSCMESMVLVSGLYREIDAICAIETGGVSFGDELAWRLRKHKYLPVIKYSRGKKGQKEQVVGLEGNPNIRDGFSTVMVDEVINNGTNALSALEFLKEKGLKVVKIMTVLDYCKQDTWEKLRSAGAEWESLVGLEEVLRKGQKTGKFRPEAVACCLSYIKDSSEWNRKYLEYLDSSAIV